MHVTSSATRLRNIARLTAAQLLRVVPGSTALRLKRDLRDAAWLEQADAVVVSFPKSGRTFVRAMLAHLFQQRFGIDERDLLDFPVLLRAPPEVPRLLFTHAGDSMRSPGDIRVRPEDYRQARVVLLARHPGDVVVSRYHHLRHRSRDRARRQLADQPLQTFVWSEQGGLPSIVEYLNGFAALPGVTIARYEDFVLEPKDPLRRLAATVGLEANEQEIADATEFGKLPNLRKREREGYFRSARLRPAKPGDEQSGKVRSGRSGGYRAELGDAEADRIDAYIAEHLSPVFGYSNLVGA
jgi:hypothetical protein